jgi:hypothetical protein
MRLIVSFLAAVLAVRAQTAISNFAGNAQHTANYSQAAQNLNAIHWSTSVDLNNVGGFVHYGAPVVTAANTVLVPVKTATNGFQVTAFNASTGSAVYTLSTDYTLPSYNWIPVYSPALATSSSGTRLYYAGAGGTVYYINNPDSVPGGAPVQQAFYGLANYQANPTLFNSGVFIDTPITSDSNGNIFFGFRVQGTAPAPLNTTQSGFARIDPNGNAKYVLAGTAAADSNIGRDSHNSAPALSNDQSTLYVVAKSPSSDSYGYLLGLDSTTLATKYRALLKDPRNGNGATITDDGTSSPMIAPDNDVYFGVLAVPDNGSRGFMLRFSADLSIEKIPGAFGWDYTPGIVPAAMVPSYTGASSYLIFSKYNNYAGADGGDGVNRMALLDPNSTQIDPHPSANGLLEMREVMTVIGPTSDSRYALAGFPLAVREWCVNTPAINPATQSVFMPNEDGHIYRWNLSTNSLSQAVQLTPGSGEAYVPTVIGPDGTVYTINAGKLFAVGGLTGVWVGLTSSAPDLGTVTTGQSITFTAAVTNTGSSGATPTGSVTFQAVSFQSATPVTTTLAANVPLDPSGHASISTSNLSPGANLITASFGSGSSTMVVRVHSSTSTTTLLSSANPANPGQPVTLTATVSPSSATGMVTFLDGATVLAQLSLSAGSASFTSTLALGGHSLSAVYASDTNVAASSGALVQTVGTNSPPSATGASIAGNPVVGQVLTGHYTYSDPDGDAQGVSTFRWLRDGSPISGATAVTYTPVTADASHSISFQVTPVAATGASPGTAIQSAGVTISAGSLALAQQSLAGLLSGASNYATNPANLTTEGNLDWIHWGDSSLNRKATGGSKISSYSVVGTFGTPLGYLNDPRLLSWNDGSPTGTGTDNPNGIYFPFAGNGFTFTAPADTTVRTLVVHVGGYFSVGKLTAHLSDSSASDFTDITNPITDLYDRNYVLTYSAASAGKTLTVSWVEMTDLGAGNVNLSAAALSTFAGSVAPAAGNPESATVGTAFATALQAKLTDANNNPVSGATVTFTAPAGGATASFSSGASATAITNASGIATAPTLTANTVAGTYYVIASVSGIPTSASFNLTNAPGAPATITATAGTPRNAVVNTIFATALQATVIDSFSNPVTGATVTFAAPANGASATFSSGNTATAITNGSGIAFAPTLTANGQTGSYIVAASVAAGVTPANFNLTNTAVGTGVLSGAGNSSITAVNLTAEGTSDWIHWGDSSLNRKATGGSQISTFSYTSTLVGSARQGKDPELNRSNFARTPISKRFHPENMGVENYSGDPRVVSWTDGSPTQQSSNNGNGLYIDFGTYVSSGRSGFLFTAPAGTSLRTLTVHVGGFSVTNSSGSAATLTAHLSDGSAPDFVDTTAPVIGTYDRNYTLTYRANSAGQTLTITWAQSSGAGAVFLTSASLSAAPGSIATAAGTPQSTTVSTAFNTALQAVVKDGSNNPLSGVTVTFTAPGSGASATFSGSATGTAVTNGSGIATAPTLTANSQTGTYTVTASVPGLGAQASYSLTNTAVVNGGGVLSGSGTSAAGTFNLTAEGTADWVHWGDATLTRKNGVAAQISIYGVVGSGTPSTYNNDPRALSWTDGTPTSGGSNNNGLYINFAGNGFSFTAPADTSTRTLIVHAGGWLSAGAFTAHLSDGSAADYVDFTSQASGQYDRNYTLTYSAASAGQTLKVSWVTNAGSGNVTLNGAALALNGAAPASIAATLGTPQTATVNAAFATNLQAVVKDAGNNPLSGILVTFTAPTTGPFAAFGGSSTATATTNGSGLASAPVLTANSKAGGYSVIASVAGLAPTASFSLTNLAGPPASVTASLGTPQSATINTAFSTNLQALVKDASSNPLSGITVTFAVPTSGASASFGGAATAVTNSSGIATASTLTANGTAGGYTVTASVAGVTPTAGFSLTNLAAPPASVATFAGTPQSATVGAAFGTNLQAVVKDASNNLLSGVSVLFTAPSAGAGASFGGSATATATTDGSGIATATVLTANSQAGSYAVTATVQGVNTGATFNLTNTAITSGGGSLIGSGTSATTTGNLTSGGTSDWVHWGDTVLNRKIGVTPAQISNYSVVGSGPVTSYTNDPRALSWSDGTPTASGSNKDGVYINSLQNGFSFTVPADTSTRTLTVYVGGWLSGGTFTAHLSDFSASDYTDSTTPASGQYDRNYTLTYQAGAAGKTLTVTWVATSGGGNVTLSGAALSIAGVGPASIAVTGGTSQSATINTAFSTPLQAVVQDAGNNPLSGVVVTFTAPATGASAAFGGSATATATTNLSGIATAPALTANGQAGSYTVTASVGALTTTPGFSLTNLAGPPASIAPATGTPQSAMVNTAFGTALQAVVKDAGNNLLSGITVTFTAPATGASAAFSGLATATATTNGSGVAIAPTLTANAQAGSYSVMAGVTGVATNASFSLTNTTGTPASISAAAGATPQSATVNTAFSTALQAVVKDASNNPLSGVTVTFAAPATGASGSFSGSAIVTTNASGIATAPAFTANGVAGGYTVTASVTGVATKASFSLTNLAGAPASVSASMGTPQSTTINTAFGTNLQAVVKDASNNLLSGVTVTFTAPPATGPSAAFAGLISATAVTNGSGIATAPVLTANGQAGSYLVTASATGAASQASFSLTNNATAGAPIKFVQGNTLDSLINLQSASVAFKSNNTAGNWIGVVISGSQSTSDTFTLTDTEGNIYHRAVTFGGTALNSTLAVFYAENIKAGANTVKIVPNTGVYLRIAILEYSGIATSNSLDVTAAAQGNSASPNSGIATTTAGGDLLLGAAVTGGGHSFTASGGFAFEEYVPAQPSTKLSVQDQVQSTSGPASVGLTLSAADNWVVELATFKAAH